MKRRVSITLDIFVWQYYTDQARETGGRGLAQKRAACIRHDLLRGRRSDAEPNAVSADVPGQMKIGQHFDKTA